MYLYRHTHLILVPVYELTHIYTEDKLPKILPSSSPSIVLSYPATKRIWNAWLILTSTGYQSLWQHDEEMRTNWEYFAQGL